MRLKLYNMVKAWRETVVIPTYGIGQPEKNPIFLEKRVYQGSSGAVYPYPVIESISDEKTDEEYHAVYIENEYIKVMILPELGGRVQMAYDKIRQRHFVYYNHVIKPALVGLTGPWISGGIEFNWPQHHRPSTYLPVDSTIEEHSDGSVTVWVNEMERMTHQKGMAGFTLRPGCAYLEIRGVLYNRTDMPQTFLWWANPAVAVNDDYQSVFPPDINAVFDHGKRAVSSFPIATGTYYKMDYSAGVDISNYRNIKVPTSYMGVNSKYDFEGGYENDTRAGMLHVASRHLSPGKKQWTWGNGDFGRAWDRNLTDADGPYIELMAGVYTENQPDFTWLMPYEEKRFTQYFMPYRELGMVKQASRDYILNVEPAAAGSVRIRLMATSHKRTRIVLRSTADGTVFCDNTLDLSPETIFDKTIVTGRAIFADLEAVVSEEGRVKREESGNEERRGKGEESAASMNGDDSEACAPVNGCLAAPANSSFFLFPSSLRWSPEPDDIRPIPPAAEAAQLPQDVKTTEQLYLTGQHLEQYRHATYSPTDYYEEALRRDPMDYRCCNAMGLWYLRRGRFDLAEGYLCRAVAVITRRNPNPYDGEPIYNLGLALKYQGRLDEAYERFWKSTWNKAWADAGYFEAAQISLAQGRLADALDETERCLTSNWHNHKCRALRAVIMRLAGCTTEERLRFIDESLAFDRFNYVCRYERWLATGAASELATMRTMLRRLSHNYDEVALDYMAAGRREEACAIWKIAEEEGAVSPMTYYYMGRWAEAEAAPSDYCFPNRPEAVVALTAATKENPGGARAFYYLGCLYYDRRQYDVAVSAWERAAELDPQFPTVWRNLALAYFNKLDRKATAVDYMERAFSLDTTDARILMELDQLYRRMQRPQEERLALLEKHAGIVAGRDDLVLERATLLNQLGRYEEAMALIDGHVFHPWEGGEGKVSAQYQTCRMELAKRALAAGDAARAEKLLMECLDYPHHLGEGKLHGAQENDFHYLLGCARSAQGDEEAARRWWTLATEGTQEPTAAMYYNDAKPDKIFYQGLALIRLGRCDEANGRFNRLVNYGRNHIFEPQVMDYFAVSLPDLLIWEDSLDARNRIHCLYMLALGYRGLGDTVRAQRYLDELTAADINHQGGMALRSLTE